MHRHAVLFAFGSYLGASTVAWAQPPGAAPEGPVIHPEFRDNRFDYDPFFYNQPNPVDPDDLDYEIEPLNRDDPLYSPWQGQRAYELDPYDASRYGFPHDFLREGLKAALARQGASFDFQVQLHPRPTPEAIEDSTVTWSEAEMPFVKVATLEIPPQDFDTPERREFGENLSFNPWRCLPEHRPLGGVGRARRQVYPALSATRHGRNAAPSNEPE